MNLSKLTIATAVSLITAFAASAQTNSVSIGTTQTNASAVLWLNSPNSNQGLIIPVGSRANVASPAKGMIIFDTNQIYAYDGTNWAAIGGASGGSQTLSLSGNSLSISGGNSVSLATAPAASQFFMFDGTNWVAKSLSQDVLNNLGVITVNGLKGKPLPASFSAGVLTSDASGNLSWSTPTGTFPTVTANQIISNDGTSTKAFGVGGDLAMTTSGSTATFTVGAGAITLSKMANSTNANQILTSSNTNVPTWVSSIQGSQVVPNFGSQNISTNGSLSVAGPTKLASNAYTWPSAALTAGTFLQTDASGNLSWATPSLSGLAGGDLTGSYPNPTLANTATTGANVIASINSAATTTINGARINTNFNAQNITTTGTLKAGSTTVSGLTIGSTTVNWPGNAPGILTNNGSGTLSWVPGLSSNLTSGNIFVGNTSNVATGVALSGDATLSNAGAMTITKLGGQPYTFPTSSLAAGVLTNDGTGKLTWGPISITGVVAGGDLSGTYPNPTIANSATTGGNIITAINANSLSTINGARVNPSFGNQNITTTGAGAATIAGGISAGSSNQFSVSSTGNITKINSLQANFPGTQGAAGSVLTNDGVGNLSWAAPTINPPVQVPANTDVFEYSGNATLRLTINNAVGQYELGKLGSTGSAIFASNWNTGDTYIAGKLGLGTTTPISVLDVTGDLHLSQLASAPSPTSDKLYNVGGSLFWNGTNIGSTFTTVNTIPKGSVSGLVSSSLYDDGTTVNASLNNAGGAGFSISNNGGNPGLSGRQGLSIGATASGTENVFGIALNSYSSSSGNNDAIFAIANGSTSRTRGLVGGAYSGTLTNLGVDSYASGSGSSSNYGISTTVNGGAANYGVYNNVSGGTVSNYGVYNSMSGAGSYGIYSTGETYNYFSGSVGIGTQSPSKNLTLFATIPQMNFQTSTTGSTAGDGFMIGLEDTNGTVDIWGYETGYGIRFATGNVEQMRLTSSGNLGIGTTSPSAPLHVGIRTASTGSVAYTGFAQGSVSLGSASGIVSNVAIRADGYIWSNGYGFVATSDKRIKDIIGKTDNTKDLADLMKLEITDYKFIDKLSYGNSTNKKVIAQQVQSVYPNAVQKIEGVIPNVFEVAVRIKQQGGKTRIETSKPHQFVSGDEVKLVLEKGGEKQYNVTVVNEKEFEINEIVSGNVFVYGKKVNDLLTVDYDALTTLNISATQKLAKEVDALKSMLNDREKKIAELENSIKALASDKKSMESLSEEIEKIKRVLYLETSAKAKTQK